MVKLPKIEKKLRVFGSDRLNQRVVRAISAGLLLGMFSVGGANANASSSPSFGVNTPNVSKVILLKKTPTTDQRVAEHYSHESHSSHFSHDSHSSHYSHYSSRY